MGITNWGKIIYCVEDQQSSFDCDFDPFDPEKLKGKTEGEGSKMDSAMDELMLHVRELVEVHMKPKKGIVHNIRLQKGDRLIAYADNLIEGTRFELL